MFETPTRTRRIWPLLGLICAGTVLCGCGQRGPLYLPDRNARVVTRPANTSAPPAAPSSAPSSAPP